MSSRYGTGGPQLITKQQVKLTSQVKLSGLRQLARGAITHSHMGL